MRIFWLVLLAGCGAAESPTETWPGPPPGESTAVVETGATARADMRACPMTVDGAEVDAEPTSDGAALVFTTREGDVAELQARVRMLADRYGRAPGEAGAAEPAEPGDRAGGSQEDMRGVDVQRDLVRESSARVEDLDSGARMVITPRDGSRLPVLREVVLSRPQELARAGCPGARESARAEARPSPDRPPVRSEAPRPGTGPTDPRQPDPREPGGPGDPLDPLDPIGPIGEPGPGPADPGPGEATPMPSGPGAGL